MNEDGYEFPHQYAFRNQYQEDQHHHHYSHHRQENDSSFDPEEFAREEYLGERPENSVWERSISSPTVSEVLQMRMLHEERRRHGLRTPTGVSVGSHVYSIRRVPSVLGSWRIYFEHHV